MALKTWIIDEIKTAESGPKGEALLEPGRAADNNGLAPGKEDHPEYIEKQVSAIIALAVREIERNQKGRQYRLTEELKACEDEVNGQAKAILSGKSSDFEALREVCARWIEAARKAPAQPETAPLFKSAGPSGNIDHHG